MKESLPQVPGKHILACCDCVVHSELQVGARLIKNSMTYFTFIFPLERGGGGASECSKRNTGLNKSRFRFLPSITWISKNFWKSCLSATRFLGFMSSLPNSFQALKFTVKGEIKKSFICS